ncbi:NAD(P)/FAD-dependent oxidoreductase [Candidatus Kaiserbacteria bacterium]|nr:NAD(P)/FAD-dependent oxidoreductase [Candidatus Kaiserbacteria bacterium]
MQREKTAVIIGAGPAGLTAAYELLSQAQMRVVVIERDPRYVGGISRTVNFKGNRIDIGGHRFFSKSDRVMRWWSEFLPVSAPGDTGITYQRTTRALTKGMKVATDADGDNILHVRPRKTRILYNGRFFDYPIGLSLLTLRTLGAQKVLRVAGTYLAAVFFPIRPEKTLEDFFLNRFGREMYETFFKTYTEKVWGVPCRELSAQWGAQRIKGLSVVSTISHAIRKVAGGTLSGKGVETSLIEQFLYPTYGPGHLWERVAENVSAMGGDIRMGSDVTAIDMSGGRITGITLRDAHGETTIQCDYLLSTTDVKCLVEMLPHVPATVRNVAEKLQYRDFITVGLLLEKIPLEKDGTPITDTWMYIHENSVKAGRVQFFHNWEPHLVAKPGRGWIGLEYFCNEGDTLSERSDVELISLASEELQTIGLRQGIKVLDGTVIRQSKAYPGYFGAYEQFPEVQKYLDSIPNIFPIGRNGMHRYNNQDHSMLTAMESVDMIVQGRSEKSALWNINAEEEYHESK